LSAALRVEDAAQGSSSPLFTVESNLLARARSAMSSAATSSAKETQRPIQLHPQTKDAAAGGDDRQKRADTDAAEAFGHGSNPGR
jgi:hypothetical protein